MIYAPHPLFFPPNLLIYRLKVSGDLFYRMGLKRNLSAAEIVEQAVYARRLVSHDVGTITNVVFMVSISHIICYDADTSYATI